VDLYGYSFALNSAKTVKSVTLPNNANFVVAAMTLAGQVTPTISLSPTSLTFNATVGGGNPSSQNVTVSNSGGGTLAVPTTSITYHSGSGWLTVTEQGSSAPYTLVTQPTTGSLAAGTYTATVNVSSTGATNSPQPYSVTFTVSASGGGGSTQVNLSSSFNRIGMYTDGSTFGSHGGLDGNGGAYSATLLGSSQTWNSQTFNLGPANASNVVYGSGQVITLPSGQYSTLQMLAAGVNGSQTSQTITVTYTDLTTSTFTQSFSDWYTSQGYSGESIAKSMSYHDTYTGGSSNSVDLYGYSFALNSAKTVKSVTLPNNANFVVAAITLAGQVSGPQQVSLSSSFNRIGMYTDGSTFGSHGGLDGNGGAYSATLLGSSQTWNSTTFNLGTANASNVVSATGQTITLPSGAFSTLRMLAAGVNGSQTSQTITVTYTDLTTSTFTQSFSDWYASQGYSGESIANAMSYHDTYTGGSSNAVDLYGYSFAINNAKTVKSITLPNVTNGNLVVVAMTLVP
jgi:predicted regulator of Ras-like GTPase activity (Roadblock/LC7/MglB family)